MVERQRELFAATGGIAARSNYEGRGEGGDMTLELDARCEDAVFAELEAEVEAGGPALTVISEERGEVTLGSGRPALKVIVDPIDGSLNVRRTIPWHSLSIAVANGDSMADVLFGFVHDFGAEDEFAAALGCGVLLNGEPLAVDIPDHGLEVVGIESAEPSWVAPAIAALAGEAFRIRVAGSIAITMAYVGAGRFDAMFSARGCRSVDAAAAQLIVREAGGAVDFGGAPLEQADLSLGARYTAAAARDPVQLETILSAQAGGPAVRK